MEGENINNISEEKELNGTNIGKGSNEIVELENGTKVSVEELMGMSKRELMTIGLIRKGQIITNIEKDDDYELVIPINDEKDN